MDIHNMLNARGQSISRPSGHPAQHHLGPSYPMDAAMGGMPHGYPAGYGMQGGMKQEHGQMGQSQMQFHPQQAYYAQAPPQFHIPQYGAPAQHQQYQNQHMQQQQQNHHAYTQQQQQQQPHQTSTRQTPVNYSHMQNHQQHQIPPQYQQISPQNAQTHFQQQQQQTPQYGNQQQNQGMPMQQAPVQQAPQQAQQMQTQQQGQNVQLQYMPPQQVGQQQMHANQHMAPPPLQIPMNQQQDMKASVQSQQPPRPEAVTKLLPPAQVKEERTHSPVGSTNGGTDSPSGIQKSFACPTCSKRFARRSDLARHERIHTGHRPHVCEHPGCGKQFIQRSALTVHSRVHTGEKPHMCEHCTKPFSDSSSLARHRRIHSGKRPYKCPYADCQKTFTRRTTLTRHQNHHVGTVEDSERNAAALLAKSRAGPSGSVQNTGEDSGNGDGSGSSGSSQSPRHMKVEPTNNMEHVNMAAASQRNDYSFVNNNVPMHLRTNMNNSPRSTTNSSPDSQYSGQGLPSLPRPGMQGSHTQATSTPLSFNPPTTLEPPTSSTAPGSATGSPHLGSYGWQTPGGTAYGTGSPTLGNSPTIGSTETFGLPDPGYSMHGQVHGHGVQQNHLQYGYPGMRRPMSTEPDVYAGNFRQTGGHGDREAV